MGGRGFAFNWIEVIVARFKRFIIFILVFNFTYAPVRLFADDSGGASESSDFSASNEVPGAPLTAEEAAEVKKGSSIDVSFDDSNRPRVAITPGTDPEAVYQAGRPSVLRSQIGSILHYMTLRHHNHDFMPNVYGEQVRDRKERVTVKDVINGGINLFNETFSFTLALGGIKVSELFMRYSANPMALEEIVDSLKDPIGHISFYSFMAANGFTTDFLNEKVFNNSASGKAMRKIFGSTLPYLSMTAGSMTSHIVGDTLHLMQACNKHILQLGRGEVQLQMGGDNNDPCELAWKDWTLNKKFHVYAPSLISMLAATWAAGKTTSLLTAAKNKLDAIAMSKAEKSVIARSFIKNFKIVGSTFGPMVQKSGTMRYFVKVIGKTPGFVLFLGLTEVFEPYINPQFENLTRTRVRLFPGLHTFDSLADDFMRSVLAEKHRDWAAAATKPGCEETPSLLYAAFKAFFTPALQIPLRNQKCKPDGDILVWLNEFSDFMQGWRDFNQQEVTASHSAWVRKTENVKNTERLSYYYYNKMLEDLQDYQTMQREKQKEQTEANQKVEKKSSLVNSLFANLNSGETSQKKTYEYSVMRLYPLYGIKSAVDSKNQEQRYLKDPNTLEQEQYLTVKKVTEELIAKNLTNSLSKDERAFLNDLINVVQSADKIKIGIKLKQVYDVLFEQEYRSQYAKLGLSEVGFQLLKQYFSSLGRPSPFLAYGLGFANGFVDGAAGIPIDMQAHLTAATYLEAANLDYTFGAYRSMRKVDHLTYLMACGTDLFYGTGKLISERFGFSDEFIAPRIVKSVANADVCDRSAKFKPSDQMYFDKITDRNDNKSYQGIFSFIIPNLRNDIQNIISEERKIVTDEKKQSNFANWWFEIVESTMRRQFEKYRNQYEEIAVEFVKTLYPKRDAVLNKGTIKTSVAYSTMQEMRLYSMLVGEIISDKIAAKKISYRFPGSKLIAREDLLGWEPVQAKTNSDIFKLQVLPYNADLFFLNNINKLKLNTHPRVYEFQQAVENLINHYHNILSKLVITHEYGKEQVSINFTDKELENFNKQKDYVEQLFKVIIDQFSGPGKAKSDYRTAAIVQFCADKIITLANQVENFVSIIKVVEYNRDKGPTKAKCQEKQVGGRTMLKTGNCD